MFSCYTVVICEGIVTLVIGVDIVAIIVVVDSLVEGHTCFADREEAAEHEHSHQAAETAWRTLWHRRARERGRRRRRGLHVGGLHVGCTWTYQRGRPALAKIGAWALAPPPCP